VHVRDRPDGPREAEARRVAAGIERTPPTWDALSVRPTTPSTPAAPPMVRPVLRSPGRPLDGTVRRFMEPRLGHAFEGVRVHTDAGASEAAQALGARAWTTAPHIAFAEGEYRPGTPDGRRLLAHELTHLLQQEAGGGSRMQLQRDPLPEQEFESVYYTTRRLISELHDHLDHGRTEEARALVPRIRSMVSGGPLSMEFGLEAAQAFFRLGMRGEAMAALRASRSEHLPGHHRHSFSFDAAQALLEEGRRLQAVGEHEGAFEVLLQLVAWLSQPELALSSPFGMSDGPASYVQAFWPDAVAALFQVPAAVRTGGDGARADAMLREISAAVRGSRLVDELAPMVTQAFLAVEGGRGDQEAFAVLEEGQATHRPRRGEEFHYPRQAVNLLLDEGEGAVQAADWERAYTLFAEAFDWLRTHREALRSMFLNMGEARTFISSALYRVMGGILAIVDHHRVAAERAFREGAQDAEDRAAEAGRWIDRLATLFADILGASVAVAQIEHADPEADTATYRDARRPEVTLEVGAYPGEDVQTNVFGTTYDFDDRMRRIETILATERAQIDVAQGFYVADADVVALFEAAHGRPPDLHSLDDRRHFWALKYQHLTTTGGMGRQEAIQALVDSIGRYLRAFTMHTEYNVPETFEHPLTADFPRSTTQQALMDCGIYAMRTAYELSEIRTTASLEFHYVLIPNHVYLAVLDRGHDFGWALSNDVFRPIEGDIGALGVGVAVANEFDLLGGPVQTQGMSSFTERGLRRDFNRRRPPTFPPGQEALRATYLLLRDRTESEDRALSRDLVTVQRLHAELEDGQVTADFRTAVLEVVESRYARYDALADATRDYIRDLRAAVSDPRQRTDRVSLYFQNMFYLMRYVVHVLGQREHAADFNVQHALPANTDESYQGDPPPWEKAVFNFSEG